jgi:hypothetical protein
MNTRAYFQALIPDLAARLVELEPGDPRNLLAAGVLMQAIEEYAQTRHALAPVEAREPYDPYPLCPECDGCGWTAGAEVAPQPWDCPPEYEDQLCLVCAGEGVLSRHAGTEETR